MLVIAVLDANVIYSAPVRDLLLQLAFSDVFQAVGRPRSRMNGCGIYWRIVPNWPRRSR